MARPEAAAEHYESQLRQAQATVLLARRQWRLMSLADLDRSWSRIVQRLTVMIASGMLGAAKAGAAYVPDALDDETATGQVVTSQFAQTASDGRPLDTLLYSAVIHVKESIGRGVAQPLALDDGGNWLETLARTQVADASRGAAGVAIAVTPHAGYERYVSPPCCQRCAVLAGKFFRWNTGFQRHPKCDCRHLPVLEGSRQHEGVQKTISPDEVRDLTLAQRRAVSDGADLNQVINSHRANSRGRNGLYTTEGTTRRGVYGGYERTPGGSLRRRAKGEKPRRLTPEGIYRLTSSREEAIRLLARYGYLTDDGVLAARRLRGVT